MNVVQPLLHYPVLSFPPGILGHIPHLYKGNDFSDFVRIDPVPPIRQDMLHFSVTNAVIIQRIGADMKKPSEPVFRHPYGQLPVTRCFKNYFVLQGRIVLNILPQSPPRVETMRDQVEGSHQQL